MWTTSATQFCRVFGIQIPIVQAPMAGGPTTPELVAAVSESGGLGSVAAGYMPPAELRDSIDEIRRRTEEPFTVNLFVPPTEAASSNISESAKQELLSIAAEVGVAEINFLPTVKNFLDDQVQIVIEQRIPIVSFTFGILNAATIGRLRSHGVKLIGTATCVHEACALEAAGCDAVVMQGFEAGGHRGSFLDPNLPGIGLLALIPQTVDMIRVPVIASGAIMDGRGIAAAMMLGAAAVQMGTAFLACTESGAHQQWKDCLIESDDISTVLTKTFSGKFARGIRNEFTERMTQHEASLPDYPIQNSITASIRVAAREADSPEYLSLWAGQSASLSRPIPVGELIGALVEETNEVLGRRS